MGVGEEEPIIKKKKKKKKSVLSALACLSECLTPIRIPMIKFYGLTISTVFRLVTDFSHRLQCNMSACLSEFLTHIGMRTVKVNPLLRNAGQPVLANLTAGLSDLQDLIP